MVKDKTVKIYMGDLTHDTLVLVSDTIPINIGFIASYAKKLFDDKIEITLFKFPKDIIDSIKISPPDIIALSNYSWNSNLSERINHIAKNHNSNVITVQGGTNFPHKNDLQQSFMLSRPYTDIFIELEAEVSFGHLIGEYIKNRNNLPELFNKEIPGCMYIEKTTKNKNPNLIKGESPIRLKMLDDIPSPYLSGMLDVFFDEKLTPFLETNRGCPFSCSFCHTGNKFYNKVNMFSLERVIEEINYIAPNMKKRGIRNLHLADVNFGMYKRDKQICEVLAKTRNEYGWPFQIMTTTGKNSKKRVIEATDILGDTLRVNMSVQSMDKSVLKNIKRENIKLDDYIGISEILRNKGRSTQAEVIIGLPGESRKTFLKGMEDLLNSGVSEIGMYTLMALHGTEFKDPEYRKQFKMKGKHRIVPLNFGNYDEENIFDIEEVIIQTKDMSFEDYLWIRGFCLTVEIIHNSRPFIEFVKYVNSFKISNYDFILALYNDIHKAPVIIKKLYDEYLRETKEELWPTENSVFKQYKKPKNYDNLLNGRVGGNLIYKYKSLSLNSYINEWIEYLATISLEFTNKSVSYSKKERKIEVDTLKEYSLKRVTGIMDSKADLSPLEMKSNYNIRSWLDSNNSTLLCDHKSKFPISYKLIFSDEQLKTRKDLFERYGTDIPALSKIVTRVGNLENLFRRVITDDDKKQIKLSKKDKFVRYSLSN